jgi:hypothetical protein
VWNLNRPTRYNDSAADNAHQNPKLSIVVLIGPSGSGKSTFARKHFLPTEVISSDACRALISHDENVRPSRTTPSNYCTISHQSVLLWDGWRCSMRPACNPRLVIPCVDNVFAKEREAGTRVGTCVSIIHKPFH